jgi:hypothetical protein
MTTYMERYLAGDHRQVWKELQTLGDDVRRPPLHDDAYAVSLETMRRVRRNLERLLSHLDAMGYEFWADLQDWNSYRMGIMPTTDVPPQLAVPEPDVTRRIEALEATAGPMPFSLRAFYEVVGAVNFVGDPPVLEDGDPAEGPVDSEFIHGGWREGVTLDPILVLGLRTTEAQWQLTRRPEWNEAFLYPLFPDFDIKYSNSGGDMFTLPPTPSMDGILMYAGKPARAPGEGVFHFVDYLRFAILEAGGFPGAGMPEYPARVPPLSSALLEILLEDVEPF